MPNKKICIIDKDGRETTCLAGDLVVGDASLTELTRRLVDLENRFKQKCAQLDRREEELRKTWERLK